MSDPLSNLSVALIDADATAHLGEVLADLLHAGDVVMLAGPIGAGKSHLARALIRARLRRFEDVPSPTFTLVQTYQADDVELWHADLYRLSHPDEVAELGLFDAFDTAICLIEWPDRLGKHTPKGALQIDLISTGDGRTAELHGPAPILAEIAAALA